MKEEKRRFIRALAEYLAGNHSRAEGLPISSWTLLSAWATLRSATPLFGYPTVDEAEQQLAEFLS